ADARVDAFRVTLTKLVHRVDLAVSLPGHAGAGDAADRRASIGGTAMNLRTRLGVTIATATLGAFGLLGMAACSSPSAGQDQSQSMSPEATALTALGFSDSDVTGDSTTGASVTTAPSAGPNNRHRNNP